MHSKWFSAWLQTDLCQKKVHMKINQNLFEFGSVLEFQVLPKEPLDISSVMLMVEGSSLKTSNKNIRKSIKYSITLCVHENNHKIQFWIKTVMHWWILHNC